MSRLLDIKERAGSVEKIKKITGALEVVAITRLRRQQKSTLEARPYSEKIRSLVFDVSMNVRYREHPLLTARDNVKNIVNIVVTSDKGLCGGFNNTIIAKAQEFYNNKGNFMVRSVTIGRKGYNFFSSQGREIKDYIFDLSRDNEILKIDIYRLADNLIKEFLTAELDELYITYSNFKLQLLGEVKILKLLPIKLEDIQKGGVKRDYIYEPEAYQVFDKLLREYLRNAIFHAVIESKTSEEMARMVAMKQATDSAGELIENLMLKFHKERQEIITRELIDIINATEGEGYV